MSVSTDTIVVSSPADFHVHLRQGELAQLVTKHVRQGGFSLAYVMARPPPALYLPQQPISFSRSLT